MKPISLEILAINQVHATGFHIRYIKDGAIGRQLHVLRHSGGTYHQTTEDARLLNVHLDDGHAKLATGDQVSSVGREIHMVHSFTGNLQGVVEIHAGRVEKVQALEAFRDHDRVFSVGRVVHIVGIVDVNCSGRLTGRWVYAGQTVTFIAEHP